MAVALPDLPRFLVLDPMSTVRLEIRLEAPACEIDVELDNPRPGRSFVLLIGHKNGPYVQRVRLAGKARIYFDPQSPGEYGLLVANPQNEPIVLRLKARDVSPSAGTAEKGTARRRTRRGASVARSRGRRSAGKPRGSVTGLTRRR